MKKTTEAGTSVVFYKKIMQEKRLELSWYCYHTDLNRTRLPIPPFLHLMKKTTEAGTSVVFYKKIMQEKRLELSWYCYHTDLNRTRLPIPPFLHLSWAF